MSDITFMEHPRIIFKDWYSEDITHEREKNIYIKKWEKQRYDTITEYLNKNNISYKDVYPDNHIYGACILILFKKEYYSISWTINIAHEKNWFSEILLVNGGHRFRNYNDFCDNILFKLKENYLLKWSYQIPDEDDYSSSEDYEKIINEVINELESSISFQRISKIVENKDEDIYKLKNQIEYKNNIITKMTFFLV